MLIADMIYLGVFILATYMMNQKISKNDMSDNRVYGLVIGFFGGIILSIFAESMLSKKIKDADARKSFHNSVLMGIGLTIVAYFAYSFLHSK